jgi:hypothetical protein
LPFGQFLSFFIAYLSHKGLAASTVSTYTSGLSHAHKINDLIDDTKSFMISRDKLSTREFRQPEICSAFNKIFDSKQAKTIFITKDITLGD